MSKQKVQLNFLDYYEALDILKSGKTILNTKTGKQINLEEFILENEKDKQEYEDNLKTRARQVVTDDELAQRRLETAASIAAGQRVIEETQNQCLHISKKKIFKRDENGNQKLWIELISGIVGIDNGTGAVYVCQHCQKSWNTVFDIPLQARPNPRIIGGLTLHDVDMCIPRHITEDEPDPFDNNDFWDAE